MTCHYSFYAKVAEDFIFGILDGNSGLLLFPDFDPMG
jgi:hypothetical protein